MCHSHVLSLLSQGHILEPYRETLQSELGDAGISVQFRVRRMWVNLCYWNQNYWDHTGKKFRMIIDDDDDGNNNIRQWHKAKAR